MNDVMNNFAALNVTSLLMITQVWRHFEPECFVLWVRDNEIPNWACLLDDVTHVRLCEEWLNFPFLVIARSLSLL